MFRWIRPTPVSERGAVATIVGVLFAGLVVAGFLATTVDVGNLMYERAQLQNGADASAMSLAQSCALGNCGQNVDSVGTLNNQNASDSAHALTSQCGVNIPSSAYPSGATHLSACPSSSGAWADCSALPSQYQTAAYATLPYVEVRTATKSPPSNNFLTNFIAGALGQPTSSAAACSRAAWGGVSPGTVTVTNIVMSQCDWRNQTGYTGTPGSATYPAGPKYNAGTQGGSSNPGYGSLANGTNPWPTEQTIYTKGNPTTCPTSSPGGTYPGGFAALTNAGGCTSTLTLGANGHYWADGTTGNRDPCPSWLNVLGKVIYVPVFDCVVNSSTTPPNPYTFYLSSNQCSATGNHAQYDVAGFAAFYVTGWYFSSDPQSSLATGSVPCGGNARCMSGFFLADLVQNLPLSTPNSTNYGLETVAAVG